jgi:pantothenate kinase
MEVQAESRSQLHRLQTNEGWEDNRPHVVLISGKAGVGKTTLAGLLSEVVREKEDHKSVIMSQSIAWGVKQVGIVRRM